MTFAKRLHKHFSCGKNPRRYFPSSLPASPSFHATSLFVLPTPGVLCVEALAFTSSDLAGKGILDSTLIPNPTPQNHKEEKSQKANHKTTKCAPKRSRVHADNLIHGYVPMRMQGASSSVDSSARYRGTLLIRNSPTPQGSHRALGLVLL